MGKILKKITLRTIGLDKMTLRRACEAVVPKIKDETSGVETLAFKGPGVKIAQFIGTIVAYKAGVVKDTEQTFVKLSGQFEAINMLTGEVYTECSTLILPNFVADPLANALRSGAQSVDFAVVITAAYDEKSAVGYEFGAESLMPTTESDAVSAIKARLQSQGVALAAPKSAPALAAPPAPAPAPAEAPAPAPEPQKQAGKRK